MNFLTIDVVPVVDFTFAIGVELADTSCNEENDGDSAEPPCHGHTCCEARHDEKDGTDDVTNDG